MDEPTMEVVKEMTQRAHTLCKGQAAELANAANHRQHGDYTRAAIAAHAAEVSARMATIYEQLAGVVSGTWLPSPEEVTEPAEGLGVGVGIVRWAPPQGASPAQLHQWKAFADALNQVALRQKYRTDDLIRAAHATQVTGQLAPEDLPQPDPLTAAPAGEETGAHVLPPAPPVPAGLPAGVEPLTSVEPDASAECGRGCGYPLVRLEGTWLHAVTLDAECRPGAGEYAEPVDVVHRDPAREAEGEPLPEAAAQQPVKRVTPQETTRKAPRRIRAGLKRTRPEQPSGDGVVNRVAEAQERGAYPDRPVHGPAMQGPERSGGPSALLLPSHGAEDATAVFPPANGDGGGRG